MMDSFACLTISPISLGPFRVALATTRSGGIALLDREFCRDAELPLAEKNLEELLRLTTDNVSVGLRLRASQINSSRGLLNQLCNRSHWLILCDWNSRSIAETLDLLPSGRRRTLVIEIIDVSELDALQTPFSNIQGVVARGHENGGWVGEDSAFVLSQKLLADQRWPVYVQGGIGINSAAACRAAGAAGVVLDDQLLLTSESPLPREWKSKLARLSGQDAVLIGERLKAQCRTVLSPEFAAAVSLREFAAMAELEKDGDEDRALKSWRETADATLGWGPWETHAWPVGQTVGLASHLAAKYKTTGRVIQAVQKQSEHHLRLAQTYLPLQPDGPLAVSHRTRYPIVQGPMTRVSDTASFAEAVSRAGALPLLALALMTRAQVIALLEEVKALLAERPFGVGILGFVPPELREQQIEAVIAAKPSFALIAGGRPDQATQLENQGIETYIHVPVPNLLRVFLAQGARRFVFEGRECGGHVGPLTSFMLWETMIETLLSEVSTEDAPNLHVLFAGGIHDARSAAMVGAMSAPLAARGIRVGVLMGTAYLFTKEAVSSGAIVKTFQDQAVACNRTINLETGPGHAIRCVATDFSEEFYATRRKALRSGSSASETREILESLTTGRLRIASKGLHRIDGQLAQIREAEQLHRGMYMIGQVATMRDSVQSMEDLHREVSEKSSEILRNLPAATARRSDKLEGKPSDIAIVGISTLLPKAQHPEKFWNNLLRQVDGISEIPSHRWDWRLYFDSERKAPDKIYSKWGGFIDDVHFDPLHFGIPPNSVRSISCSQLLALEAVRRALADAGYESGDFDRERTSVILGSDGGGVLSHEYITRASLPLLVDAQLELACQRLPEWTEESFPGTLTNVTAGRVANRFDFGGSNYTVDAACASSLTAVDLAIQELESGRSNVVIAGGIDTGQSPFSYVAFSKTQALSPRGRTLTFDQDADGIVISEGVAILVLKRLADAERDGDRIYAVIKAVAGSSDGKAMGMTAPRPLGQMRAFARAYEKAGIAPHTLGMYEAHGTGTAVGDRTELETIISILENDGTPSKRCAIGSVKSLVGHTKTTAGVVGLVKTALALYHKVLPPQANIEKPLEAITAAESPVYLLSRPRPWLSHPEFPRRASVSAFGFGGTNEHAVLEEYRGGNVEGACGDEHWPCELVVISAENRSALENELSRLLTALESVAKPRLRDLAYSYARRFQKRDKSRNVAVGIVVEELTQLKASLRATLAGIHNGATQQLPAQIRMGERSDHPTGRMAFVFPGQGSQYVNMAREATLYLKELRTTLEFADQSLKEYYPQLLSQYIYPPAAFTEVERRRSEDHLRDTHVAQPAIGAISLSFFDLAARLGIRPDMVCGHSYGEFTALCSAGVISREDFFSFSETRGRTMATASESEDTMLVVHASREEVSSRLNGAESVVIANHNAPLQTVIAGDSRAIRALAEQFNADGIITSPLRVAGAFHSPLMASAQAPLLAAIESIRWRKPLQPVYSNVTARPYAETESGIRSQVAKHLLSPVEFVNQIEQMYVDGARVFVELGPKSILSDLIDRILEGREHVAVSLDGKSGGMRDVLLALGTLITKGVHVDLPALFDGRNVQQLDLDRLAETTKEPVAPQTSWLVDGGSARPLTETASGGGRSPLLTDETAFRTNETAGVAISNSRPNEARPRSTAPNSESSRSSADIVAAYEAYQKTMQQFLELQEQALKCFLNGEEPPAHGPENFPSLAQLTTRQPDPQDITQPAGDRPVSLDHPPQAFPARENVGETKAPTVSGETIIEELDQAALTEVLVHLVSERTGYPGEMLGLDLDLESELGVDSIKRIEILHELQKRLAPHLGARMIERMDSFASVKSINHLVRTALLELVAPSSEPRQPIPEDSARLDSITDEVRSQDGTGSPSMLVVKPCPRYIIEARAEPLSNQAPQALRGLFLITADGLSVAEHVATELRNHGARAVIFDQNLLASAHELRDAVLRLQQQEPITGILHLAPLTAGSLPGTLREWRLQTQIQSKSLFHLLQLCADSLRKAEPRGLVLAASLLGGFFGRNKQTGAGLPTGGSSYGLLNSLKAEWPNIQASAIDFDHRLSPEDIGRTILAEMTSPDAQLEVGYPEGRRTVFSPVRSSLERRASSKQPSPSAEWVVLALGGARGITAEIARSLCLPGMKMVLVGRSPEPVEESRDTLGVDTVEELRSVYLNRAKDIRQTQTPAAIERQIKQLLRGREIRCNLDALRKKGAQVEYHALDVSTEAFASLIDSIYLRYGRLDAVIHGAGVIEDKLLVDKSPGSFDRVFDTKVDSAYLLSQRLRADSLKLVVLFSSLAGRIGNPGQSDYAAANEVLNCFASRMKQQWPGARVVAINWGPWDEVGMASDAVRGRFKERGIAVIKSEQGRKFFLDEISFGDSELVEVIAGDGPWAEMTMTSSISPENFGDLLAQVNTLAEDFWAM